MNLLDETMDALRNVGHSSDDVVWIGSDDGRYWITWDEFAKIADQIDYDQGFGAVEIPKDLVVVFLGRAASRWLRRRTTACGAEWWELVEAPTLLPGARKIGRLACGDLDDDASDSFYIEHSVASLNRKPED